MKVKILRNTDALILEANINSFIKDKDVRDIKYQMMEAVTESYESGAPKTVSVVDSVVIMYEEKSKEGENNG